MNYHNISKDDMLNGQDLGVVLWVSCCSHRCPSCQNPETWAASSGIPFEQDAKDELFYDLDHDYIKRLTLSGGDPLHKNNLDTLISLVKEFRERFGNTKKLWIYSGYQYSFILEHKDDSEEDSKRYELMSMADVFVDGKFYKALASVNYHWAGSTNQLVINVPASLSSGTVVLLED